MEKEDIEINRAVELESIERLSNQFSLDKVKTYGTFFDRVYSRNSEGKMELESEKAVVRCQGKTTKVLFGDEHEIKTYKEAEEWAKRHWGEYFKERRRLGKSAQFRSGERRRQKTHYAKKIMAYNEIKTRQ